MQMKLKISNLHFDIYENDKKTLLVSIERFSPHCFKPDHDVTVVNLITGETFERSFHIVPSIEFALGDFKKNKVLWYNIEKKYSSYQNLEEE